MDDNSISLVWNWGVECAGTNIVNEPKYELLAKGPKK